MFYYCDANLDYLVKMVSVGFLHYEVAIFPFIINILEERIFQYTCIVFP